MQTARTCVQSSGCTFGEGADATHFFNDSSKSQTSPASILLPISRALHSLASRTGGSGVAHLGKSTRMVPYPKGFDTWGGSRFMKSQPVTPTTAAATNSKRRRNAGDWINNLEHRTKVHRTKSQPCFGLEPFSKVRSHSSSQIAQAQDPLLSTAEGVEQSPRRSVILTARRP